MENGILEVDISEFEDLIWYLRSNLTPQRFNQVMYDVFKRTGNRVKTILKQDLPRQYYVKAGDIESAVRKPKMQMGGTGVGCVIPIKGPRGSIGGTFSASGGAHGWRVRKYRVRARIVKSGQSTLPEKMSHQGGQPPFRNLGSSLGKAAFTRETKNRLPIKRISGIAVPQMPLNRSEDDVAKDILEVIEKRLDHHFDLIFNR